MQRQLVVISALGLCSAVPFVQRCGSNLCFNGSSVRFAGANIYWLGLDENVPPGTIAYPTKFRIVDALTTAATVMGATVVRGHTLGISVGNPLSFEPSLGVFNDSALDAADYAIFVAGELGLRLQVPLTDNYHYYHGGKHTWTDWLGIPESDFYTNSTAIAAYQTYVKMRLAHVNPYNGLAASADSTIMMWETGNELLAPAGWTNNVSAFIKALAPNQLVMDGNYGVNSATLDTPTVDAYSDHFYPVDIGRLESDIATVAAADKLFVVGEFGWTSGNVSGFLAEIEGSVGVAYDAYWSLFPHADTHGFVAHNDGFSVNWPGNNAAMASAASVFRQHAYAMAGQQPPANSIPGAPLITALSPSVGTNTIAWRGAAGGGNYSVEVSSNGAAGPYVVVCNQCANDNDTPWHFNLPLAVGAFVRVRAANVQGQHGPYSPINITSSAYHENWN